MLILFYKNLEYHKKNSHIVHSCHVNSCGKGYVKINSVLIGIQQASNNIISLSVCSSEPKHLSHLSLDVNWVQND